jgi:hypothetical protein
MVTITVEAPKNMDERMKLIETLTKEKGYKLIEIDVEKATMLFEINSTNESQESNKPILLCD